MLDRDDRRPGSRTCTSTPPSAIGIAKMPRRSFGTVSKPAPADLAAFSSRSSSIAGRRCAPRCLWNCPDRWRHVPRIAAPGATTQGPLMHASLSDVGLAGWSTHYGDGRVSHRRTRAASVARPPLSEAGRLPTAPIRAIHRRVCPTTARAPSGDRPRSYARDPPRTGPGRTGSSPPCRIHA